MSSDTATADADAPSHDLLENLLPVARAAGEEIMRIYASDFDVRSKPDASPVTDADERAEAIILEALEQLTPGIPIVSEEAAEAGIGAAPADSFWLVDPLDGTKEFVRRSGEFTTNIALIDGNRPVLGIVLLPALDRVYAGASQVGAFVEDSEGRRAITCRTPPSAGLTVVASKSHGDPHALEAFLAGRKIASSVTAGSSLKFCLVAAGEADLYPRLGRTMEWDTAAGHAVVDAAGGRVSSLTGAELGYGKPGFENPHFVVRGL